jgi:hypothetical protein
MLSVDKTKHAEVCALIDEGAALLDADGTLDRIDHGSAAMFLMLALQVTIMATHNDPKKPNNGITAAIKALRERVY